MRILLVDEDVHALDSMEEYFRRTGASLTAAPTGSEGLSLCMRGRFDLIVLEHTLPDMSAYKFLAHLEQKAKNNPPIIVLSHESGTDQKVVTLSLGADRYMTKPYHPAELAAMMEVISQRADHGTVLQVGSLKLDKISRAVSFNEKPVKLTKAQYQILELLMRNEGSLITIGMIAVKSWGRGVPSQASIAAHMYTLRGRLTEAGARPDFIKTIWNKGFAILTPDPASPIQLMIRCEKGRAGIGGSLHPGMMIFG